MTGPRGRRVGFTFLEIIVAVAIIAIVGATVYATLGGARDRQRVGDSHAMLAELTRIIDRFDSATGGASNGRHPGFLYQLNNSITVTQTAGCTLCRNVCGAAHTSSQTPGWVSGGPFFQTRDITQRVGMRIPIGLVRDSLIRDPSGTPADQARTYGLLKVQIDSVEYGDAVELKLVVDAFTDSSKGVVRWTTDAVNGVLHSIYWTLPIAGC